ncbi:MAG: class I SAM-dependent methyltransferase [Gammaproteobacteria bacterium]
MSPTDPRWGQEGRDRKAEAILATLRLHCSQDLREGIWLDIGCGSGGIAATLAAHVERVVGVDPEPWERWQSYRSQHLNLAFHVGSYRDLETLLGADSCSVVICNQVYEHVDDPRVLLAAIHHVLKPDGVCYFAGPNLLWPIEPHVYWPFVHWLPRSFAHGWMRTFGSKRAHDLDAWSWSYWHLVQAFRNTGFQQSVAVRERVRAHALQSGSLMARVLAGLPRVMFSVLAPCAPGFVFVLRKTNTVTS